MAYYQGYAEYSARDWAGNKTDEQIIADIAECERILKAKGFQGIPSADHFHRRIATLQKILVERSKA